MARALMLQGTGSDVGKSLLVAGLCRAASNRGIAVAPFKPQNMSNNAAVCAGGGEIGRAQALQARAARVESHVDMNPVLLKPQSDVGAQVVVQGRVLGNAAASGYQNLKPRLLGAVIESFERLCGEHELVIVEGAGSPAEINLRAGDIANMGFALPLGVPVALVGDIDRGGVIASLVGTHQLLPAEERRLVIGFIINKFRGDVSLFEGGLRAIEARTGWQSFGVLPWLQQASRLPAEDAVALERTRSRGRGLKIAVPMLSRISNFDDFDPLGQDPEVDLVMVPPGQALPGDARLVIVPGTKATLADLAFFEAQGWHVDLEAHLRRGGEVLGICGGYQLLGTHVADPHGIEGPPDDRPGLGWLDVSTELLPGKSLRAVRGTHLGSGEAIAGFEMHVGRTTGPDTDSPLLSLHEPASGLERFDGARSRVHRVSGCYVHGLFASDAFRGRFLAELGAGGEGFAYENQVEQALDDVAARLELHLDVDALLDSAASMR
ncbi:MAG: cobyric acid synthase [Myxococcales bacterium]|nr:cobyric acid synthase [Myxococcales bacterium]